MNVPSTTPVFPDAENVGKGEEGLRNVSSRPFRGCFSLLCDVWYCGLNLAEYLPANTWAASKWTAVQKRGASGFLKI